MPMRMEKELNTTSVFQISLTKIVWWLNILKIVIFLNVECVKRDFLSIEIKNAKNSRQIDVKMKVLFSNLDLPFTISKQLYI